MSFINYNTLILERSLTREFNHIFRSLYCYTPNKKEYKRSIKFYYKSPTQLCDESRHIEEPYLTHYFGAYASVLKSYSVFLYLYQNLYLMY